MQTAEVVWAGILSEDDTEIERAFHTLDADERTAVVAHLRKMADPDEGYADVQQRSARFALEVLVKIGGALT